MTSRFLGTDEIKTSTANEEVVPKAPEDWTNERYNFTEFSFINKAPCKVKINGGAPIFLDENQGFNSSYRDQTIVSFIIVEADIPYTYIGRY